MKTYRVLPGSGQIASKNIAVAIGATMVVVGIGFGFLHDDWFLGGFLVFAGVASGIYYYSNPTPEVRWVESIQPVEVILDGDTLIIRSRRGDRKIRRDQVSGISDSVLGFTVWGQDAFHFLCIPRQLEGYEELVGALRQWGPAKSAWADVGIFLRPVLWALSAVVAAFGSSLAERFGPHIAISIFAVCLLIVASGTATILRSASIEPKEKKLVWIFVIAAALLLYRIYELLPHF